MIDATIFEMATGQIRWAIRVLDTDEANMNRGGGLDWIPGRHDAATTYIADGEPAPRPAIALPAIHTLPANTDWTLPDAPEGTTVIIDGAEAGTVDSDGLTLSFPLAGTWHVELRPPFPWLPVSCEVVVT